MKNRIIKNRITANTSLKSLYGEELKDTKESKEKISNTKDLKDKIEDIKSNIDLILSHSTILICNYDLEASTEGSFINSTAHNINDILKDIEEYLKEITYKNL